MIANEIRVNLSLENERNEHDRGPWLPRTSYSVGDRVQEGGLDYICVSGYHYSAATFAEDMAEHWVDRQLLYAVSGAGGGSSTVALLSDIGNVSVPTSANDGQAVTWSDATQQYVFVAPGALLRLSEVGNVPTPTIANDGQVLAWDDATQSYLFVDLPVAVEPTLEHLTITTLNTIPDLAAAPTPGTLVTMFKNSLTFHSTAPVPAFSVAGTAVTYNEVNAGTDLFPGDLVAISYR